MEQWRDVPGYEGLYQISIEGEVCCRNAHTGKILSNTPNKRDKRVQWHLCKEGKRMSRQAARWVALTFPELVENEYFEGAEIDHKDTNRMNNQPSNLRWVTRKENLNNELTRLNNSISKKLFYKANPNASQHSFNKCLIRPVLQYSLSGTFIARYSSIKKAKEYLKKLGFKSPNISSCCMGKIKSACGFIWKYE